MTLKVQISTVRKLNKNCILILQLKLRHIYHYVIIWWDKPLLCFSGGELKPLWLHNKLNDPSNALHYWSLYCNFKLRYKNYVYSSDLTGQQAVDCSDLILWIKAPLDSLALLQRLQWWFTLVTFRIHDSWKIWVKLTDSCINNLCDFVVKIAFTVMMF